jgi:exopolysaccharide biosynthesis polyprenyl glycosylphosphotransferase
VIPNPGLLLEPDSSGVKASPVTAAFPITGAGVLGRQPVLLATLDLTLLLVAYLATALRLESYTFDLHIPDPVRMVVWCTVLLAIWVPVAVNLGAYDRSVVRSPLTSAYVAAKATLISGALFHIVPLVGGPVYSRVASMTVVLALVAAMLVWRLIASRLVITSASPIDLVVLGAGWAGQALADAIAQQPHAGMRIVAFVETDPERIGSRERNLPIYGLPDLPRLIARPTGTAWVVLAIPDEAHAAVYEELTALAQAGVKLMSMASVYEHVTGRVPVHHLGNFWWAMLPSPSEDLGYLSAKRFIDIVLALLGLLLLIVLLPVVRILVKLDSAGPLFFVQERVGRFGRPLKVVKLRTLRATTAEFTDYWERKRANKPSRLGALLRATGIDELPQCLNVLKGEMSIVGPRPYVAEEVADFQRQIPFFRCRSLVKPGLTGWAQVNWGYGLSLKDEIEKLQYDLYYVGHQSFYLDLLIMLRTVGLALRRRRPLTGASRPVPG